LESKIRKPRRKKLKVYFDNTNFVIPIYRKDEVRWEVHQTACPHCKAFHKQLPIFDIVQYGLLEHGLVTTVFQCTSCRKWFGIHYELVHMAEDDYFAETVGK
jgi:hypothetical protein